VIIILKFHKRWMLQPTMFLSFSLLSTKLKRKKIKRTTTPHNISYYTFYVLYECESTFKLNYYVIDW
jgi:hypothetical protein